MEIVLRGVRGSIAAPASEMSFYGGNTACIEIRTSGGTFVLFDAGSGLCNAGEGLPESGECHIFITHGHTDHLQGLGFFHPLHSPAWTTHLYIPEWLENVPDILFANGMFPIPFSAFKGNILRHPIRSGQSICIDDIKGGIRIETFAANHPGDGLAYKAHADGSVFLYSGDHEIAQAPQVRETTRAMLQGVDIAVVDAMYRREDLKPGWGHSDWESWLELSAGCDVGCLVLSHHAPDRTDRALDILQQDTLAHWGSDTPLVCVAREGMRFSLPFSATTFLRDITQGSDWLDKFLDDLSRYQDESTILDRILAKAREITRADAGTVFLAEGDELVFSYTHNDTLYSMDKVYRHAYSTLRLPISEHSIAGYAAVTGKTLNIADVRALDPGVPYAFNGDFDESTGYRTCSMLTVPFHDHSGELSGVLQLINSLDPSTGEPRPFSLGMERHIRVLAREAASILERSALARRGIYRILHMAAVHDPVETGPHAERVGAVAAELYQHRANKLELNSDAARHEKSRIRLAAMLHDVGKVGISDLVLKKPAKLTDEEFETMRAHTEIGASILGAEVEDIMPLARDIALHHHQKWDGSGYAGRTDEGRLSDDKIPLAARITALADVFDALVSPRCYKAPWTFDEAMAFLRKESGKHFDPFLVECMEEIRDVLVLIYKRFPDKTP
ncbi:HD domain-containing protein [Desulfovibrio sp. OttesenSCG-928-O18]|nr:HD domain-containing protein [Desulfovibrio sp. OttesenSCG-928-O18]